MAELGDPFSTPDRRPFTTERVAGSKLVIPALPPGLQYRIPRATTVVPQIGAAMAGERLKQPDWLTTDEIKNMLNGVFNRRALEDFSNRGYIFFTTMMSTKTLGIFVKTLKINDKMTF